MTRPPFELALDLNGDLDFADASEVLSADVLEWQAQVGADAPFTDMARANTLRATLRNTDQRYSPEHASGLAGFEPGALIRLRLTDPATAAVTTRFIGWIDEDGLEVVPGQHGARETQVRASGFFTRLLDQPVRVPLQTGKRADEIIDAILQRAISYPPGLAAWLLGDPLLSQLGVTTFLASGVADYASLEQGATVFSYAGDTWARDTSAFRALSDVVRAERGFLYESPEGKLVFYNRHHWQVDMATAVDATLSDADVSVDREMEYAYGNVVNRCVVKFHPRSVGSSTEVLAQSSAAPRVIAGQTHTLRLMLDDGSGNRIGATALITPVANVDWTANSAEDGSGTDVTSAVSVSAVADANAIELTFVNSGAQDAYIRSLQVRGTRLTDFGEVELSYQDDASIRAYKKQVRTLDLGFVDDFVFAGQLSIAEVQAHKTPTGQVRSIGLLPAGRPSLLTYALSQGIGARIALAETQTGASGDYHLIGRQEGMGRNQQYWIRQFLQPAPLATAWILGVAGYSELGETSYLGL